MVIRRVGWTIGWGRAAAVAALLFASGGAFAQEVRRDVDPRAAEFVKAMTEALAKATAFTFHAEILYDEPVVSGEKLQFAAAMDVAGQRPDHLAVDYVGDLGRKRLWYDGQTLTLLDGVDDVVATAAVAPPLAKALDAMDRRHAFSLPLGELVREDAYAALMADAEGGFVVGPGDVGGVDCVHLAFRRPGVDWQIWIETGERPLPRKLVLNYPDLAGAPQYMAVLSDWKFPKSIPAKRFVPDLPDGVDAVEFAVVEVER